MLFCSKFQQCCSTCISGVLISAYEKKLLKIFLLLVKSFSVLVYFFNSVANFLLLLQVYQIQFIVHDSVSIFRLIIKLGYYLTLSDGH